MDAGAVTCATDVSISANHGHTITVSAADIAAGVDQDYDIQGSSTHPHSVTVTAADFAMLAAGSSVSVESTNDDRHTHTVTVTC